MRDILLTILMIAVFLFGLLIVMRFGRWMDEVRRKKASLPKPKKRFRKPSEKSLSEMDEREEDEIYYW